MKPLQSCSISLLYKINIHNKDHERKSASGSSHYNFGVAAKIAAYTPVNKLLPTCFKSCSRISKIQFCVDCWTPTRPPLLINTSFPLNYFHIFCEVLIFSASVVFYSTWIVLCVPLRYFSICWHFLRLQCTWPLRATIFAAFCCPCPNYVLRYVAASNLNWVKLFGMK